MGDMNAVTLARHGIRFGLQDGRVVCFGPPDRPDLYRAMRGEIARRQAAMEAKIACTQRDYRAPVACAVDGIVPTYGICSSCGDSLGETYRAGDCWLCVAARQKALVAAGRLPP